MVFTGSVRVRQGLGFARGGQIGAVVGGRKDFKEQPLYLVEFIDGCKKWFVEGVLEGVEDEEKMPTGSSSGG